MCLLKRLKGTDNSKTTLAYYEICQFPLHFKCISFKVQAPVHALAIALKLPFFNRRLQWMEPPVMKRRTIKVLETSKDHLKKTN